MPLVAGMGTFEPLPLSINGETEDVLGGLGGAMLSVKDAVSHSLRYVDGVSFPLS